MGPEPSLVATVPGLWELGDRRACGQPLQFYATVTTRWDSFPGESTVFTRAGVKVGDDLVFRKSRTKRLEGMT